MQKKSYRSILRKSNQINIGSDICHVKSTGHVKLVQAMVNQCSVTAAFGCVLLQGAICAQASSPRSKPSANPEALKAESQQGPESCTGQVQLGGGQGATKRFQTGPQVMAGLCKITLWRGARMER